MGVLLGGHEQCGDLQADQGGLLQAQPVLSAHTSCPSTKSEGGQPACDTNSSMLTGQSEAGQLVESCQRANMHTQSASARTH